MVEIIGVTESFDSFVARLSSGASRDGIARGVAIELYSGVRKFSRRKMRRISTSSRCLRSVRPVLKYVMAWTAGPLTPSNPAPFP